MSTPAVSCCAASSDRWKNTTASRFRTPRSSQPSTCLIATSRRGNCPTRRSAFWTPPRLEDARVAIAAREAEKTALVSDSDLGSDDTDRIAALDAEVATLKDKLAALESDWSSEQALVNDIRS